MAIRLQPALNGCIYSSLVRAGGKKGGGGGGAQLFWLDELRILLPPSDILHYGILIYFRISMWVKRQPRKPFGRLLREQSQILPIDSGESPPFLIDESPQFHATSWLPLDKVQSCFAVKETAFQFGCSNFPAGRTRSYTSMAWSVAFSIARNHSNLLREHGVCQNPAFSPCFSSPKVWRTTHYLYFTSLPTPTAPFSPPRPHNASHMHKHSHPYCQGCRNHLPCCSSWDTPYRHATSWK